MINLIPAVRFVATICVVFNGNGQAGVPGSGPVVERSIWALSAGGRPGRPGCQRQGREQVVVHAPPVAGTVFVPIPGRSAGPARSFARTGTQLLGGEYQRLDGSLGPGEDDGTFSGVH